MPYCLPKFIADTLKGKFKSGEVNPDTLSKMTSEERRTFFNSVVGEGNSQSVNALFESKLLLKNQQLGFVRWAQKILNDKPEIQKDFLFKVDKMKDVMSPKEIDAFLSDYVEKKLGIGVTVEEAGKLVDLAKRTNDLKTEVQKFNNSSTRKVTDYTKEEQTKRIEYGTALTLFKDYVSSLKPESKDLTFKEFISTPSKYIENIGAISKSIVASIDNSFWGNQGITTLLDPRTTDIWVKNFIKSWGDIGKELKGVDAMVSIKADVYSRPNAINGTYAREKIATGLHNEEAYPTSLPEKIPFFKRFFKASTSAYNGAALRLRADVADRITNLAVKNGVDITEKARAEAIGHMVNSSTGRGSFGVGDATLNTWNSLMFSPRLLKGTFDTLTAHLFDKKVRTDPFARKQAAYKILGMTATYYALTSILEALNPGSTGQDPRGAHFGQIKIGNNWVNITGAYRPLIRTLSVLIPTFHNGEMGFWKQSASGKWDGIKLFPTQSVKYGALTPLDIAEGFLEGKASPLLSTIMTHWRGADFNNKLPTPQGDLTSLVTPITLKNYFQDQQNPNVDNLLLNTILNSVGINSTPAK